MALVNCPNCNNMISETAYKCPRCGISINKEKHAGNDKRRKVIVTTLICFAAVITIILIIVNSFGKRNLHSNEALTYKNYYTPKTGKDGALSRAKRYLDSSYFSYSGLVAQLEFEGYENYEAVYAADNCGADWNIQAVGKAKEYVSGMFKYDSIITCNRAHRR